MRARLTTVLWVRSLLAILTVGACVIVGCAPDTVDRAARLGSDSDFVLDDLARVFGAGIQDSSPQPFPQPPSRCGGKGRRTVTRLMRYRRGTDDSLSGRTVYDLNRRGYRAEITQVVHSGEGTYGVAYRRDGRQFAFISAIADSSVEYELTGYLGCRLVGLR